MVQEFQVIIFAGGAGNRMYPLTDGIPKNMLPVANRPLISYQLELLERVGISDAIIIVNSDDAPELQQYVSEMYKGKLKISFDIFKGRIGTAEALLRVKDKIKSNNFIVLSGDLIVQEGFLHSMADIHRTRDAALTVLLKKVVPTENEEPKPSKSKEPNFHDFIGLSEDGRLLYLAAAADLEENMIIRKSLLRRFPNMTVYTSLLDSHFYIFSKWVLDFLESQEHITSLKGELIPELLELQIKKSAEGFEVPKELLFETESPTYSSSAKHEKDKLGCFAYVLETGFCARVNTIPSYLEANREVAETELWINHQIAKGTTGFLPWETVGKGNFVDSSAEVNPKTQVGPECIVGAFTQIGEKCSIKKSIIGKHCKIGNNVKIINSVIMNHVTILDNIPVRGTHKKSSKVRMGGRLLLLPKPGDQVQSTFPLSDPKTGWTIDSRRCGAVARKIGMTMEWDEWGALHALTILEMDKCQVLEIKTKEKHGYTALKLGVGSKFIRNMKKSEMGEYAKAGVDAKRYVEECKVTPDAILPVGTEISVRHFVPGQKVDVCGKSRGRGFMGAMRRWGFKGLPASHGVSLTHRSHGATGARQDPGKVWKGKKMAGKEGRKRRQVRNCHIFELHPRLNIVMVSGSVPGRKGSFVRLQDAAGYVFPTPPPFPTFTATEEEEVPEVIRGPNVNPYRSQLPELQPNFFTLEKFINEHPEKMYQKKWEALYSTHLPNNLKQLLDSRLKDIARAQAQELQAAGKRPAK